MLIRAITTGAITARTYACWRKGIGFYRSARRCIFVICAGKYAHVLERLTIAMRNDWNILNVCKNIWIAERERNRAKHVSCMRSSAGAF
jgi:hypothetical protein